MEAPLRLDDELSPQETLEQTTIRERWWGLPDHLRRRTDPAFGHLANLVEALREHPRASRFYPMISMVSLNLSRTTDYPFAVKGLPRVFAGREGRYGIYDADGRYTEADDLAHAL